MGGARVGAAGGRSGALDRGAARPARRVARYQPPRLRAGAGLAAVEQVAQPLPPLVEDRGPRAGCSVVTLRCPPVSSFTVAVCTAIPATAGLASASRSVEAVHAAPVTVGTRRSRRSRAIALRLMPRSRMSAAACPMTSASAGTLISVLAPGASGSAGSRTGAAALIALPGERSRESATRRAVSALDLAAIVTMTRAIASWSLLPPPVSVRLPDSDRACPPHAATASIRSSMSRGSRATRSRSSASTARAAPVPRSVSTCCQPGRSTRYTGRPWRISGLPSGPVTRCRL